MSHNKQTRAHAHQCSVVLICKNNGTMSQILKESMDNVTEIYIFFSLVIQF